MEINRKIVISQNVRYLKALMGVRYYVDCRYSTDNGKTWNEHFEDNEEESNRIMKLTPNVVTIETKYGNIYDWELVVDLETGKVQNWPKDFCLQTEYKVCDEGDYSFLDEHLDEVINITKEFKQYYVPDFLSLEGDGFGDYVYLNINGDGSIEHFDIMRQRITNYFNERL